MLWAFFLVTKFSTPDCRQTVCVRVGDSVRDNMLNIKLCCQRARQDHESFSRAKATPLPWGKVSRIHANINHLINQSINQSNFIRFQVFCSLVFEQPVSRAEDRAGILCLDIRERIIWAIFERFIIIFCNVSTPKGLLQANTCTALGDTLYTTDHSKIAHTIRSWISTYNIRPQFQITVSQPPPTSIFGPTSVGIIKVHSNNPRGECYNQKHKAKTRGEEKQKHERLWQVA